MSECCWLFFIFILKKINNHPDIIKNLIKLLNYFIN